MLLKIAVIPEIPQACILRYHGYKKKAYLMYAFFLLLLITPLSAQNLITSQEVQAIAKKYGQNAKKRLLAWKKLVNNNSSKSERTKLKLVNQFFNQFEFTPDIAFVSKSDYWMTPLEFIVKGGGDCEDFSIAKYFTLLSLGIPMKKLRIMYVKSLELNQAHMVLIYYDEPWSQPLVLDNLTATILPATKRQDLVPVYSFNGNGLWLNQVRAQATRVGSSQNISKWQSMLQRMKNKEILP